MSVKFTELEKRKAGEVGLRIREYRKKENLTQEELGQLVGVPRQLISAYEIGRTLPIQDVAYKLAEVFQVPRKVFYFPRPEPKMPVKKTQVKQKPLPAAPLKTSFYARLKRAINVLTGVE